MNRHIIELRQRLLKAIISVLSLFIILFCFRNNVYSSFALPLTKLLPHNSTIIATNITDTLIAPMKLCFLMSLYFGMPVIIYQAWCFIAPGLYKHEKKNIFPIIIVSCILFYIGSIFALYVIIPLALKFFLDSTPDSVTVMADIMTYLEFTTKILFFAGIAFQIPLITRAIIKFGIMSKTDLQAKRPYIIIIAFILGMLFTPPDVVSQILLALPMWLLYELGLLVTVR